MIPFILIGAILMWAAPNQAGGWNIDLIGQILFWIGVVTTVVPSLLWMVGVKLTWNFWRADR